MDKTINQSWKVELEKEMKRIAEEIRKNEQPASHPEEDTSEYYDCLYAPYIEGFSERLKISEGWSCFQNNKNTVLHGM